MAEDVIVLLDLLGWTRSRSLHLVGVSMGGMCVPNFVTLLVLNVTPRISLELCDRIHDRIASLTLAVTSRGYGPFWNLPSVGTYVIDKEHLQLMCPSGKASTPSCPSSLLRTARNSFSRIWSWCGCGYDSMFFAHFHTQLPTQLARGDTRR